MAVEDKGGRFCCRAGTEWALTGRPRPGRRPMGGRTRRRKTLVDSKQCMNEGQLWPRDSGSMCEVQVGAQQKATAFPLYPESRHVSRSTHIALVVSDLQQL